MGLRFRKSINLGKGFKINLSKSGVGGSWGVKGLRFTRTAGGKYRATVSLPGTGLSYSKEFGGGKKDEKKKEEEQAQEQIQEQDRPIGEEAPAQAGQEPRTGTGEKKPDKEKKEGSAGLKVVLWILTIFFGVIAVTNMPQVVGYLSLVAAALLLPAEKWQAQIGKILPGWLKIVAVVGLSAAVLVMNPFGGIAEMLPEPETTEQTQSAEQTDAPTGTASAGQSQEKDYVLNTSSKKFHEPDCSSATSMKEANKDTFHGTREALIDKGYEPCGKCDP